MFVVIHSLCKFEKHRHCTLHAYGMGKCTLGFSLVIDRTSLAAEILLYTCHAWIVSNYKGHNNDYLIKGMKRCQVFKRLFIKLYFSIQVFVIFVMPKICGYKSLFTLAVFTKKFHKCVQTLEIHPRYICHHGGNKTD